MPCKMSEFDELLESIGGNRKELAEEIGMKLTSVTNQLAKGKTKVKPVPKWAKSMLYMKRKLIEMEEDNDKALHIGSAGKRYQLTNINLADLKILAIGDIKTNKVVCHFITENGFDEAVDTAKKIVKALNGR